MDDNPVNRRRMLGLSGTAAVSVLSGCASVVRQTGSESTRTTTETPNEQTTTRRPTTNASETSEPTTSDTLRPKTIAEPQFDVPTEPLPTARPTPRYPTLGTANTTLTVYGNWKCPYTQQFVRQQFGDLVDEFVVTGDVSVEFRNVAYADGEPYLGEDAPRATEAGLAVWNIDPSSFWPYFSSVFANQPQERYEWATTENLVRFAERVDASGVDQIRRAIRSRTYAQSVRMSAERAAELGVSTVPRVVYGETLTAPTVDPESTREQFELAAEGETPTGDGSSSENGTETATSTWSENGTTTSDNSTVFGGGSNETGQSNGGNQTNDSRFD